MHCPSELSVHCQLPVASCQLPGCQIVPCIASNPKETGSSPALPSHSTIVKYSLLLACTIAAPSNRSCGFSPSLFGCSRNESVHHILNPFCGVDGNPPPPPLV